MTAGIFEAGPSATASSSTRRQRILRNGVSRGMTEFRHAMRRPRETLLPLAFTVAVAIVLSSVVGRHGVSGTSVPTSDLFVAGYLSYGIVSQGLVSLPQVLGTEREDGTLLRMRNIPGGIPAYLISKVVSQGLQALMSTTTLLVAAVLFVGFPAPGSVIDWLLLVGVLTVGFVAVMLAGAAVGAVLPSPRGSLALVSLFVLGLMFISGVFYPVTSMPRALQLLGEIFPLKWMAQGVRAATLPDALKTVETGGSWQISLVFGVLASWIAAGAVLAPRLLRRMTRRESGSSLQTRRERAQRRLLA
jgi:ABC-2 type transport system permease protein